MGVLRHYEMDEGSYKRIPISARDSDPPWDDLSAVTAVVMRLVRDGETTVREALGTLDAPSADGRVKGAGCVVPFDLGDGYYHGEMELQAPVAGYPQVRRFKLTINKREALG